MDIFTTQLTKVLQVPIKQRKLKVKALSKDAKTKSLNEDEDHLTHQENPAITLISRHSYYTQSSTGDESEPSKKDTGESTKDDSDEPSEHIDIFI
jgi:hypothetical protein